LSKQQPEMQTIFVCDVISEVGLGLFG